MKKVTLGRTGIEVSELCFGVLPIGPRQKNVPIEEGVEVLVQALRDGITFFDTAQVYGTYPHIRQAMEKSGIRPVIASKSFAQTYEEMDAAVKECLAGLGVDYVDIFLLHAARAGADIFQVRQGAYQCLLDYKAKGVIKAVGVSTHSVEVVNRAAQQEDLDVVFPLINKLGMGVLAGDRADMEQAMERCFAANKGVYIMKALAGGNLANDYDAAMTYVRDLAKERAAVAVGMVNKEELSINLRYYGGEDISGLLAEMDVPPKRFFILKSVCKSCGQCVEACHSSAVSLTDEGVCFDEENCLKCGYCVAACPEFAIRMV